ncbi:retron Ec48 family effector membrane protein [Pseudoalteromonas marina]|uniref:Retron Ec48 family effector membrane protein n=1 Tax=Pseudoalteromonas marina TaxID=267375 RepID=A0ABT9FJI5_9GAMM|nr:retron Ec48 family effector membrane protein [Pseudoalteromonas marina]MDP2566955.1 retron Ec48 family effector membrane protein [Pseudoalteromonas marina]
MESLIKKVLYFYSAILFIFIVVVIGEFWENENLEFEFCLSQRCISLIAKHFEQTLSFFNWLITSSAILITAISLFINFKTYENAKSNSDMSNHLSHLSFFNGYIEKEVLNLKHVSIASINKNKLYFYMFPKSVGGILVVCDSYKRKIQSIRNHLIDSSKAYKRQGGNFDYRTHQTALISLLNDLGISMINMHKKDFYIVETELIYLLDSVSQTFSRFEDIVVLGKINRHYS